MTHLVSLVVLLAAIVVVPATSRAGAAGADPIPVSAPAADKVNINTADVKTLMTLTGVGRKVAEKIVEYRDNHGPFKKADELRKVEGVGSGVWEKNRDRVVTK
jgi:competence protein ComEA